MPEPGKPLLLTPRPRSVERRPGHVRVDPALAGEVDRLLERRHLRAANHRPRLGFGLFTGMPAENAEAYLLTIEPAEREGVSVSISARGDAGVRHGLRTLRQIIAQSPDRRLPCVEVHDEPAFAVRGVMLDVSRDKVPTMDQLRRTVDLIAGMKFNHLQLYTEHAFAYEGHGEVWAGASPMTAEEVRELDDYASARGVELAANQNCFGHLGAFLNRPAYNHLAEIEGDNAWRFMQWERRGPFSLCPILPESESFVRGLLGQLLPNFRSPLVNIGCDETFDVGWGRSREEVARRARPFFESLGEDEALARARADLFFDFVNRVCAIVRAHGKRPLMWADIAMSHPEMLDRLGKDVVGLAWCYEPPPEAKFAEEVAHLRRHGLEAWVCPGTSSWRSITGRTSESRANMLAAAACAGDARGFLVCDWGDAGHMQQWPITLPRLADAAEGAWNGREARLDAEHTAGASLHTFNDPANAIVPWLDELGDLDRDLRLRNKMRNATAIFSDLFPPIPPRPGHRYLTDAPTGEWERIRERLDRLESAKPRVADPLVAEELDHTLAMARLAVEHGLSCRLTTDGLAPRPEDLAPLRARAEHCLAELRRLWTVRNRVGGLERSSLHLKRVIESLGPT